MNVILLVALSENRVIGKDNQLLWYMPEDLKHFKRSTLGKTIVMGRKTFESIDSKPLPKRRNIVLSKTVSLDRYKNVEIVRSKQDVWELTRELSEVFIVGGELIYRLFLSDATHAVLTKIHTTMDGEAFFPELDEKEWELASEEFHGKDEKNAFDYTFLRYARR